MDINQQLQPIVSSLIDGLKVSIEKEVRDSLTAEIINKVASTEVNEIISSAIEKQITDKISKFNFESATKSQLDLAVTQLVDQVNSNLVIAANGQISTEISRQIEGIDVRLIVNSVVESKLRSLVIGGAFPDSSIPLASIDFKNSTMSGDYVKGGIIRQFGSTGIEDRATFVQLTLMDHASVFESPVFAPSADIKGTLTVDGDLIIKGDIPTNCPVIEKLVALSADKVKTSLDDELFQGFSHVIEKNLRQNGIDLNRITQDGKEIVVGSQLGYHITDSNLQRVGLLRDLQTQGEAYLSDTLYVTPRRVGIRSEEHTSELQSH